MTFEEYLKDNCGMRILESLEKMDPGTERCTFPGRIMDDESFLEKGTCCTPLGMEVERVYYKPCDEMIPHRAGAAKEMRDSGEEAEADQRDLEFLLLFKVEFLTFIIGEESVSEPSKEIRKYCAECSADIDDGALRNFRMTDIHDRNLMEDLDIEMRRKQGDLSRYPVEALNDEEFEDRADAFLERYCPVAKEEPMRVPVRTIFRKEFGMKSACDGDENRFTMTREGCRRLWDGTALKLLDLLDEKDGNPPFPEAMHRIMDRNAKRTAAAILMPSASLIPTIRRFLRVYKEELAGTGAGDLLKNMIYELAEAYEVSVKAMKIRLEDLGFEMFGGVLNHLDGEYVPAFTTSEETPAKCGRYLIGMSQLKELLSDQPELLMLCEQEKLAYVEGKLVLNQCEYVQVEAGERTLTPYARTHVDECCVRFHGRPGRISKPAEGKALIYSLGRNHRFKGSMR